MEIKVILMTFPSVTPLKQQHPRVLVAVVLMMMMIIILIRSCPISASQGWKTWEIPVI